VIAVEPTVPNLIEVPCTVPLMGSVLGGLEIVMVPRKRVPDCRQLSLNVPL
jgi:hypothetical protein